MVFIFAKNPTDELASLVKQLDKVVADNEDKRVAAVVNFSGELTDEYAAKAMEFGKKHEIKHVALTLTGDGERFNVNEDAELTVMHYVGKVVKFNYAIGDKGLTKEDAKKIVDGTETILASSEKEADKKKDRNKDEKKKSSK